jgi:hypothetical protein
MSHNDLSYSPALASRCPGQTDHADQCLAIAGPPPTCGYPENRLLISLGLGAITVVSFARLVGRPGRAAAYKKVLPTVIVLSGAST